MKLYDMIQHFWIGSQYQPAIAALKGGNTVVVWTSEQSASNNIYGQQFDSNGNPVGLEFRINEAIDYTPPYSNSGLSLAQPAITALDGGGFAVVWSRDSGDMSNNLYGRRFDA